MSATTDPTKPNLPLLMKLEEAKFQCPECGGDVYFWTGGVSKTIYISCERQPSNHRWDANETDLRPFITPACSPLNTVDGNPALQRHELLELLRDAQEELRLIRMKDSPAVYDPTLRARISIALSASVATPASTGEANGWVSNISQKGETMNFGQAIEALKQGQKVSRSGWNGKNMWLGFVPADQWGLGSGQNYDYGKVGNSLLPWIGMKTADGAFVPWLASQTDVLAEDWGIVA